MKTTILIAAIMGALMLLILPAAADYSGDHPLVSAESGTINGDVLYLVEDNNPGNYIALTEPIPPNTLKPSFTQTFTVSIPDGAVVTSAKLYNYYTWSKVDPEGTTPGAPAEADITFSGETSKDVHLINSEGCDVTNCDNPIVYTDQDSKQYWDSKGPEPDGTHSWNVPNGNIVVDVTDIVTGSDTYTATIEHASGGNTYFFRTYGFALVIVYEDETASQISYWITEGADILWNTEGTTTEVLNPTGFNKGSHNMQILAAGTNVPFRNSPKSLTEILLDDKNIGTFPLVSSSALSLYNKDVNLKDQYSNIFSVRDLGDFYTVFNAILVDR